MATDDSDITLGPGKLLGLFFLLVAVCAVFFAIGYSLGKTSAREQAMNDKSALSSSSALPASGDPTIGKPSAVVASKSDSENQAPDQKATAKSAPDMTFYNAVKQSDHAPQAAPVEGAQPSASRTPSERASDTSAAKATVAPVSSSTKPALEVRSNAPTEAKAEIPGSPSGSFVVQIAAVSREEDAAALAGALRKKSYSVFVVNNPAVHDKLYHVQVGPFATPQDAEAMKTKLTSEGYNPIVKRS